jgi:hypothetical protein
MVHSIVVDRRRGRRYLVVGSVVISTGEQKTTADLVNLGPGGLLAFCDASLELGALVDVQLAVQDYPLQVRVRGRVIQTAVGLAGIGFLEEPEDLREVLLWLEAGFLSCFI